MSGQAEPPYQPPHRPKAEPPEPVDPPPTPLVMPNAAPVGEIGARSLWTLAEALVAAGIAWIAGLSPGDDPAWFTAVTVVGSAVLSALKSFIATKVGNPETVTFS